jgi:hypothetical protein
MISDIVSQHNRRRQLNELDCDGIDTSPVSTSCVPVTEIIIVDGRRGCVRTSCICQFLLHVRYIIVVVLLYSLQEGCQQCTGVDDDDDTASYSHNDESGGDRRQMSGYDSGYEGAYLTFTVTAQVPTGEDPLVVMKWKTLLWSILPMLMNRHRLGWPGLRLLVLTFLKIPELYFLNLRLKMTVFTSAVPVTLLTTITTPTAMSALEHGLVLPLQAWHWCCPPSMV